MNTTMQDRPIRWISAIAGLLVAAQGFAADWTPAQLGSATVKNWYDAADLSTVWTNAVGTTPVTADAQTVLRWNDKSGNGNHVANSAGPTYRTGVMNGKPVLRFSANDLYTASGLASMGNSTDNFTVIGVFKVSSNANWDSWIRWGGASTANGDPIIFITSSARAGGPAQGMEFAYYSGVGETTDSAVVGQPPFLFMGALNQVPSPDLFSVWKDGVSQGSLNPTVRTTPSASLSRVDVGCGAAKGDIAELLILNTGTNNLSQADREKIEGYLAQKWWGTGSNNTLPSGHPYKNSVPVLSAPATPAGLAVSAGTGRVTLTWNISADATSYRLKRATVPGGPYTTVATRGASSYVQVSCADYLLDAGTYYYVVSATNAVGESANSGEVSAATPKISEGLWSPLKLGSTMLKNWYDAADVNTLWQNTDSEVPITGNGYDVKRWDDKGGNGNHVFNATGPAYTTNVMNSLPVVRFNNQSLSKMANVAMGNPTDNVTVIGVFKKTATDAWFTCVRWGKNPFSSGDRGVFGDGTSRLSPFPGEGGSLEFAYFGGYGAWTTQSVVSATTPFLFIGSLDQVPSPDTFTVWKNGTLQYGPRDATTVTAASTPLDAIQIGGTFHGDIAELLILNTKTGTLAQTDREKIEGYLAHKWWGAGTDNPLPAGHPYKTTPPLFFRGTMIRFF